MNMSSSDVSTIRPLEVDGEVVDGVSVWIRAPESGVRPLFANQIQMVVTRQGETRKNLTNSLTHKLKQALRATISGGSFIELIDPVR